MHRTLKLLAISKPLIYIVRWEQKEKAVPAERSALSFAYRVLARRLQADWR
jgi:hypothetical protein